MSYKVSGSNNRVFDGKLRNGTHKRISTGTPDKALANQMQSMWDTLVRRHRAWDILERIVAKSLTIGTLYDLWVETKHDVEAIRRKLEEDVDLGQYVDTWYNLYCRSVKEDSADHAKVHVRWIFPENEPKPKSTVTAAWLTSKLSTYGAPEKVKRNTRRKVHSSWSTYFAYLVRTGVLETNPMDKVDRPTTERSAIEFYELADVDRIVKHSADPALRALYALMYGSGIEISVAINLRPVDFDTTRKEVRAAGTKAHTRDRVVRIADWAWPTVQAHIKTFLPHVKVWGQFDRHVPSKAHLEIVKALELPQYPLYNCRHHWAARQLRAGTPLAIVQNQLGHASPMLTLSLYGRFIPSTNDRAYWEAKATEMDKLQQRTA